MSGAEVEVIPPQVKRAITWWQSNPTLPGSYFVKDTSTPDVPAIKFACEVLADMSLDPRTFLKYTFAVRDKNGHFTELGMKADLQRAICERVGYEVHIDEVDDTHIVGHMVTPTGPKPPLTKHLTRILPWDKDDPDKGWRGDRDLVSYAKSNWVNYDYKSRAMMEARLSTELINLYARGAMLGLITPALHGVGFYEGDEPADSGPGVRGEVPPGPEHRDDSSTVPEHMRQPSYPDEARNELIGRLDVLMERAPDQVAALAERIKPWRIPNLRSEDPQRRADFKVAHGVLLEYLFAEIENDLAPPAVYDDAPEARGEDPERPFE